MPGSLTTDQAQPGRRQIVGGLLGAVATGPLAAGCGARRPIYRSDPGVGGSVARVERLGGYPDEVLRVLLWAAKMPAPVPVVAGVDLYRVSYWSQTNGRPALVSGLMSVPRAPVLRGVVLWMHGTNIDRARSVSKPSLQEGVTASAVLGCGYLMLAPDLLGLGVSRAVQAYLYNPSTIAVTLDFLAAAQAVARNLGKRWAPDLYIAGFSQGGHSTAVIHREIERRGGAGGLSVRAAAGVAGAYNLADISIPFAMRGRSSQDSVYLSSGVLSYATYGGHPLETVLADGPLARRLLDGDHADEAAVRMPASPRTLFTQAFLDAFDAGRPNWFIDTARANEAYKWAPKAPFRAYVGEADVDVPPEDSEGFIAEARRRGGNAELVSVGRYDHNDTVFHAAPRIRAWFDALSAG